MQEPEGKGPMSDIPPEQTRVAGLPVATGTTAPATTATPPVTGGSGTGTVLETPKPARGRRSATGGSGLRRIPGVRPMKEYPLTKGDMRDLAKTGVAATVCFSFASGLFGFMVNLAKDLSLAQGVPDKVVGFWNA